MIRVTVDPANPGQFFACCGLLELADRLWQGAGAWFEKDVFCIACGGTPGELLGALTSCKISSTLSDKQLTRLKTLLNVKKSTMSKVVAQEKAYLSDLWDVERLYLAEPIKLWVDWWQDEYTGGSRFKTWAGKQFVIDLARGMQHLVENSDDGHSLPNCLSQQIAADCLPFNFDSDLGGQGSALDVGFSFDPLAGSALTRIDSTARPCLELLAFVGLQRFRPRQLSNDNRFLYCAWNRPLRPAIAAPAACGLLPIADAPMFEFRLLYRTKYLKSFLPAIPFTGDPDE